MGYFKKSLSADIEFDDDFVGKVGNLPACPYTDANGWCRNTAGVATKMAVNEPSVFAALASGISSGVASLTSLFSSAAAASTPVATPTAVVITPAAPMAAKMSAGGVSTTVKVAVAVGVIGAAFYFLKRK